MVAFRSLQHRPADRHLEQRVTAALAGTDPIRFRHVTVSARSGVVVLLGQVSSFYARSLVFQHVQRLPGVESVIDSLQVDADTVNSGRVLESLAH